MTTMFVRHHVADFAKWKQVYDDFLPTGKRVGATAESVFRSPDDPSDITVTHEFGTLEEARRFVQSDELRGAMGRAGVTGEPTIWFGLQF